MAVQLREVQQERTHWILPQSTADRGRVEWAPLRAELILQLLCKFRILYTGKIPNHSLQALRVESVARLAHAKDAIRDRTLYAINKEALRSRECLHLRRRGSTRVSHGVRATIRAPDRTRLSTALTQRTHTSEV